LVKTLSNPLCCEPVPGQFLQNTIRQIVGPEQSSIINLVKPAPQPSTIKTEHLEQTVGLGQSSLTKLDIGPIFKLISLNIPDIRLK
jgi:hypothetical protein